MNRIKHTNFEPLTVSGAVETLSGSFPHIQVAKFYMRAWITWWTSSALVRGNCNQGLMKFHKEMKNAQYVFFTDFFIYVDIQIFFVTL